MSTHRLTILVLALPVVALLIAAMVVPAEGAVPCKIGGRGQFTTPDNACTPGAYTVLPRFPRHPGEPSVCITKDRPSLPVAQRRKLLVEYGVPGWTGRDGELDHRVPVFLGGLTVEDNLWPERGAIPNRKDALEVLVRRRICVDRTMRVRTAVRLFLADWRHAYEALVAPRSS